MKSVPFSQSSVSNGCQWPVAAAACF